MTDATPTTTPAATTTPSPTPAPATTPAATDALAKPADAPAAPATTEAKPADAPAKPAAPADKPDLLFDETKPGDEAKPAEGEDPAKDKNAPVPTTLADLKLPEDMPVPEEMKADVEKFFADSKLSKEQAQAVIDMNVKVQQKQLDTWTAAKADWRKETENDPTYGGKNLEASKAEANRLVRTFGDDQLKHDIQLLGLGNKLSFMRFLNKIAAATKEDSVTGTNGGVAGGDVPIEKRFYPEMK